MNQIEFDAYVESRLAKLRQTFITKGAEYVKEGAQTRFHNFELGARVTGYTRERVLHIYFLKHFISYMDMLDGMEKGKSFTEDFIKEKFGDMLAYMMLQEAQFLNSNGYDQGPILEPKLDGRN